MQRICVIDMPGLSHELLSTIPANSSLGKWLAAQATARMTPEWPAVTCSVQASLTTGVPPARHGIIANGIATYRSAADQALIDSSNFPEYRREVSFWEQSNQLLRARRFWQDSSGRSACKTALLFFQNAMPGFAPPLQPAADIVVTPKPEHGPDGKITSLLWTEPRSLEAELFRALGPFPLMKYWGPMAGIESSQWIAQAAAWVWRRQSPQLQLTYIPHLDYDLQRFGPDSPQAAKAVIDVTAAVEPLVDAVLSGGGELLLLSEYSMKPVSRIVQPNRLLANAGLLVTRDTRDGRLVDYRHSAAFAMVDHQIAHVYVGDLANRSQVQDVLAADASIRMRLRDLSIDHERSGDLILEAAPGAWFDYRWWSHIDDAPTFAREVDIHRKPGYDACELFYEPTIRGVSQDPGKLRGSHGAATAGEAVLAGELAGSFGSRVPTTSDVALVIRERLGK